MLLETGQTTCYAVGDDGDREEGIDKVYTVVSTSGTSNIEVAHYAAATIAFVNATSKITDSGNGLATVLTGDTIVIKGSTDNDGTYTVATGAVVGEIVTTEALTDESAGAVVSIYKRAAHSNNCVQDTKTGKMWSRYTSNGEAVGVFSTGPLNWYDVATRFTIYAAANTMSVIMPGNILRIIGGAALTQFHVGDLLMCAGFANAVNNLPMMYVVSVTVNGADLDVVVDPGNQVLIAEGAVGDTIYLNCRSIFNYAAGANLIGLSGYTDWRVSNAFEGLSLFILRVPAEGVNAAAFPGWPTNSWTSTTRAGVIAEGRLINYQNTVNLLSSTLKTAGRFCALIRG